MFHGPELDAAMNAAKGPDSMPVCETALDSRTNALVDLQLDFASEPSSQIRAEFVADGVDVSSLSDDDLRIMQFRSVIGGTFTYGIAVGLALAAQGAPR